MSCCEEAKPFQNGNFWTTFEHLHIACAVVNTDGKFCKINESWTEMLGFNEAELHCMSLHDLTDNIDRNVSAMCFNQVILGEKPSDVFKKTVIDKDGKRVPVICTTIPARNENQEIVAAIIIYAPIMKDLDDWIDLLSKLNIPMEQKKALQAQCANQAANVTDKISKAFYLEKLVEASQWSWDRLFKALFLTIWFFAAMYAAKYLLF